MKILKQNEIHGKMLYTIEVCGKCFEDVQMEVIPRSKLECRNCKHYEHDCRDYDTKFRKLDCEKYANKWKELYHALTCVVVAFMVYVFLVYLNLSKIRAIAMLIIACTVLDIICCIAEELFCYVREKMFCRKLEKKEEAAKKAEEKAKEDKEKAKQIEENKAKEQLENCFKMLYYQRMANAEVLTNMLMKMLQKHNFGESHDKIAVCYQKLSQTLDLIKKDRIFYGKLSPLFEVYLPEFYNVLRCYTKFMQANAVTNECKQTFIRCVDNFSDFLNDQKLEEIFKDASLEEQFNASVSTIEKMIGKGEIF